MPLFRSHFIGVTRLVQTTNTLKLKEILSLPASTELRRQTLEKLAQTPFKLWQKSLPAGAAPHPELIGPLLDDLVASESYIEIQGPDASFDSFIAVELDEQRARLWDTNLRQLLVAWKLSNPQNSDGPIPGWHAEGRGVSLEVHRKGNWTVVGWSLGKLSRLESALGLMASGKRPIDATEGILELEMDFPRLAKWSPLLARHRLAPMLIKVSARGEYLRTEGEILLAEPLRWKFQPWQIPTNLISDPLTSFSVAQGIEPIFRSLPGFDQLGFKSAPSQFCAWGQRQMFNTYWSFPVTEASNLLVRIAPNGPRFIKQYIEEPPGRLIYVTNRGELVWSGLPFAIPILRAVKDGGSDYLLLGLLPPSRRTLAPPQEVFAQLSGRTNLLYYDWEITQGRLDQARHFYQMVDIAHLRTLTSTNQPTSKWAEQAAPHLGNTITEVVAFSANDVKLTRRSHVGFTGFELATLLRWLDSPSFPLDYDPPPSARGRTHVRPK
jgi:hypothetical protein